MAKRRRVAAAKSKNQKNRKRSKNLSAIESPPSKTKATNRGRKLKVLPSSTAADDSSEELEYVAAQLSGAESQEEDVSDEKEGSMSGADEEKRPLKSAKGKGKEDVRNKGRKRIMKEEDDDDDDEERGENLACRFPMNRVKLIIKDEIPDRVSQEAVFLINKATEKFLQLFTKEAYLSASLDQKHHTAYDHLSFVVSKGKRFSFLSDFVPERMKAEEALAQISEVEKSQA